MGEPLVVQALLVPRDREVQVDRRVLQVVGLHLRRLRCPAVNKVLRVGPVPLPVNLLVGEPLVARAAPRLLVGQALLAVRVRPRAVELLLGQLRGRLV